MLSSVDLPQPDGPDQHDELAALDVEVDALQHLDCAEALAQAANAQRRHVDPIT